MIMEGLKSRAVALVVCAALILVGWFGGSAIQNAQDDLITLRAAGLKADTVVMTIGEQEITAAEYLYWLTNACDTVYQYYGITDWSMALSEDLTAGDYAKEQAAYYVSQYAASRQMAEEKDVTLTEEQQTELDGMRDYYVGYYGSEEMYDYLLAYAGLTEEMLTESNVVPYLYETICAQLLSEGGELEPTEARLQEFAETHGYTGASDEMLLLYYTDTGYGAVYDYVNDYIEGMEVVKTEAYDAIDVAEFYPALLAERQALPVPSLDTDSGSSAE